MQIDETSIGGKAIRFELRASTAAAHATVDALYSDHDLGRPDHYRAFLQRQASVLLPLEAGLEAAGAASLLADWPARRRSAAILADLAVLDRGDPRRQAQDRERRGAASRSPLPSFLGRASLQDGVADAVLLGALYVLEGSRLGGRVLLKRVLAGEDPACRSATFFLRHGVEDRLWAAFLHVLEGRTYSRTEVDAMTTAALEVFDLFARAAGGGQGQPELTDEPTALFPAC